LINAIDIDDPANLRCSENGPRDWAVMGYTVTNMYSAIDGFLANHNTESSVYDYVFLINLGANDVANLPDGATWKTRYTYIIDAVLTKYPTTKIYLTKPWRRNYGTECDTLAGYIDDLVALYPGQCYVGDDERTWLEGGDNGATMSTDGVHYSEAGYVAKRAAVRAIIGY
jgi:lysophospholipase L1-like esterase